jgi:zinc transport system substrate-binding protein
MLDTLDARLQAVLEPVRDTPVFLAQPFFQYFLTRYGLRLVRVIEPIPGKEATPRLLQQLIEQAQTTHVAAIFTLPQLPSRAAEVVGETAALPIYQLDPLGGVEGREAYGDLLWYNARIIRDALSTSPE